MLGSRKQLLRRLQVFDAQTGCWVANKRNFHKGMERMNARIVDGNKIKKPGMISKIKSWLRARKLNKAILNSDIGLPNVLLATSIQREAHEQYSLGSCTCSVMKDRAELKGRLERINKPDLMFDAMKAASAEKAWLES